MCVCVCVCVLLHSVLEDLGSHHKELLHPLSLVVASVEGEHRPTNAVHCHRQTVGIVLMGWEGRGGEERGGEGIEERRGEGRGGEGRQRKERG